MVFVSVFDYFLFVVVLVVVQAPLFSAWSFVAFVPRGAEGELENKSKVHQT